MKKIIAIALCALFATHAAEARTLYVNASRPNNKGNGYKASTAKKTIQAAINIAKKGDTILVYPGTYAPIKTNNKKITIKSVKGKEETRIKTGSSSYKTIHVLNLGDGKATTVSGFHVSAGINYHGAVLGGTVRNSTFSEIGGMYDYVKDGDSYSPKYAHTFYKTALTACVLNRCAPGTEGTCMIYASHLNRCRITGSTTRDGIKNKNREIIKKTVLANCLFVGNAELIGGFDDPQRLSFIGCDLLNCTLCANVPILMTSSKVFNSILYKTGTHPFKASSRNTFKNCCKNSTPRFVENPVLTSETVTTVEESEWGSWSWTTTVYTLIPGDCRLRKGSPCIDKGKLTKAQKKLVGTKDLAGRKRIRGKAIDRGCYEY